MFSLPKEHFPILCLRTDVSTAREGGHCDGFLVQYGEVVAESTICTMLLIEEERRQEIKCYIQ